MILCCKDKGNVHRTQRLLEWISLQSWIISSSNNSELNTVSAAGTVLLWLQTSPRVVNAVPELVSRTRTNQHAWVMTSLGSERPRRHLIHRILSEHTDHGQVESFHPSVWTSAPHKFTKERFFPEHDEPAVHERSEDCVARFWSNPWRKPL